MNESIQLVGIGYKGRYDASCFSSSTSVMDHFGRVMNFLDLVAYFNVQFKHKKLSTVLFSMLIL